MIYLLITILSGSWLCLAVAIGASSCTDVGLKQTRRMTASITILVFVFAFVLMVEGKM